MQSFIFGDNMNGLYIHIPFCARKCAYCDFVSYADKEQLTDAYLDALLREMAQYRGEKADTIFIGGGTPSILTPNQIKRLCKMVFDNFDMAKDYEFTIEANPGTLDEEKTTAMLEGGINRVSVGVQSFNDAELRAIGRIHNAETAYNTILNLKKSGFNNINLDLMTALPDQTIESLKNTLKTAASLPVTHISAYSLIIEDGTPLEKAHSKGDVTLPTEDEDREMYSYVIDCLAQNGFNQYEISNFARKGYECRHNIKYWTFEPYIGLGVAAHSFDGESRAYNTDDLQEYIAGSKKQTIPLTRKDKISEFIITGLRMSNGISTEKFKQLFGDDIENIYGFELIKFMNLGLIQKDAGRYFLSRKGIDVSNSVLCEFV